MENERKTQQQKSIGKNGEKWKKSLILKGFIQSYLLVTRRVYECTSRLLRRGREGLEVSAVEAV